VQGKLHCNFAFTMEHWEKPGRKIVTIYLVKFKLMIKAADTLLLFGQCFPCDS